MLGVAAPAAQAGVVGVPAATWQANGPVWAVAVDARTGVTYIGGDFDAVRPAGACATCDTVPRSGLAAFDHAGHLLPWRPKVDGTVYALAASDATQRVYVGGHFTHANGRFRGHLASFRRGGVGLLTRWRPNASADVHALALAGRRLVVGGSFTRISGRRHLHVAAYVLARGTSPRSALRFRLRTDRAVLALAPARDGSGRLFLGGSFLRVNGRAQKHLAAVSATSGRLEPWRGHPPYRILALAVGRRTLYAGEGGPVGGALPAYSARDGSLRWHVHTDGDVQALALVGDALYAGGHFQNVCGGTGSGHGHPFVCDQPLARRKLFALSTAPRGPRSSHAAARLTAWNPGANSRQGVHALLGTGRGLVLGGEFTRVGGRVQQGFARFR
jgi:hypothetical protein